MRCLLFFCTLGERDIRVLSGEGRNFLEKEEKKGGTRGAGEEHGVI